MRKVENVSFFGSKISIESEVVPVTITLSLHLRTSPSEASKFQEKRYSRRSFAIRTRFPHDIYLCPHAVVPGERRSGGDFRLRVIAWQLERQLQDRTQGETNSCAGPRPLHRHKESSACSLAAWARWPPRSWPAWTWFAA